MTTYTNYNLQLYRSSSSPVLARTSKDSPYALTSVEHSSELTEIPRYIEGWIALSLIFEYIWFSQGLCQAIAMALQYLYTAAIFWMGIEGVHLYRKVVKVFMKSSVKKFYYIVGWG